MVVLKAGDWCLFENRVVKVINNERKSGRYLVAYNHNGEGFFSYIKQSRLTLLPKELNPILSDSILTRSYYEIDG
jgi:hypothetical protein